MSNLMKLGFIILLMCFLGQSIRFNKGNHMRLKNNDMEAFRQAQLKKHNQLRKKHHAPALQLDDTLNAYAQQWAEHLAEIGTMVHSDGEYGENLYYVWSSPPRDYKNGAATQSWYNEIQDYNFQRPGFSSKTGHFTQVVWKGSEKVGFGIASTNDGKDFVVAEYDPPGNYIGEFPDNVLAI